jgi:hypothetical protein
LERAKTIVELQKSVAAWLGLPEHALKKGEQLFMDAPCQRLMRKSARSWPICRGSAIWLPPKSPKRRAEHVTVFI